MARRSALYFVAGVAAASVIGLTTDQILQNIYDSSNQALRTNVVAGGGSGGATPTPVATATPLTFGTSGVVAVFGSPELQSSAGSTCASGFATGLSASGVWTCATPVPPAPDATATPQPTATPVTPQYRAALYTGSASNNMGAGGINNFVALGTDTAPSTTETQKEAIFPIAFTATNLLCYVNVAPASGKNWVFTMRTGTCGASLSNSTLTCTITGNGSLQTCTDTHSVSISANQCVSMNGVGVSSPAVSTFSCSVEADY